MNEKTRPTFLERLDLAYPCQFEVIRKKGMPVKDYAIFPAKNKHFGNIEISGDLNEWRDEEDYFVEDENGLYHDADTCGLWFRAEGIPKIYLLSPTAIFYMLNKIFSDQMVGYVPLIRPHIKGGLYEIENFKKMLKAGNVRKKKLYRFWSGDYPISTEDNCSS
jgi:hypothetical protein